MTRNARLRTLPLLLLWLVATACSESADKGDPANAVRADWRDLFGLNTDTGDTTPELRSLLKKTVRIPGFVVPLEDDLTEASTFLLVPNFGACVHLPAPPPNQMVLVEMSEGQTVEVDLWSGDAIWVVGELQVAEVQSPWGAVAYSMVGHASLSFRDGLQEGDPWL